MFLCRPGRRAARLDFAAARRHGLEMGQLGLLFIIITVCGLISKVYLGLGVVFTGTILYLLTNNLTREEKNSY